jgi:hypothetical protein
MMLGLIPLTLLCQQTSATGVNLEFNPSGKKNPNKHIVLLAGDEEYRSEEMLPQLAAILATRHGFKCTVVFSQNANGEINPDNQTNQPGIDALKSADLCIMMLRFRNWDPPTMKVFADYYQSGKPIVGIRTSTHAFNITDPTSPYKKFDWRSKEWPGGFGKQVLGETWISHWGNHGFQATKGVMPTEKRHPILSGISDIFGTTDVYEAAPPQDAEVIVQGEVLDGMLPTSTPVQGRKKRASGEEQDLNQPRMPIAWVRTLTNESNKKQRIFTTTMGSATDFTNEGYRRLLVNATFWSLGKSVPKSANVDIVGDYRPSKFGFGSYKKGVRVADYITALRAKHQ